MLHGMAEVLSRIEERKKQTKAISKAVSISILNQVVSSGTNFFLGVYLVRRSVQSPAIKEISRMMKSCRNVDGIEEIKLL